MSKKVLVAYGTRYGAARIVARDISEYLGNAGAQVEVVDLKKDKPSGKLPDYDLIVAGSGIAMISWVGSVKRFLKKCRKSEVPTAVYITCGTAIDDVAKAREKFLDKVLSRIGLEPVASQAICPIIDFRPGEGLSESVKKRIAGTVKAMAKDDFREDGLMDFRDKERFKGFLEKLGVLV
jgi:menaquinone-dependent protoporphyrinogen IX oxidase